MQPWARGHRPEKRGNQNRQRGQPVAQLTEQISPAEHAWNRRRQERQQVDRLAPPQWEDRTSGTPLWLNTACGESVLVLRCLLLGRLSLADVEAPLSPADGDVAPSLLPFLSAHWSPVREKASLWPPYCPCADQTYREILLRRAQVVLTVWNRSPCSVWWPVGCDENFATKICLESHMLLEEVPGWLPSKFH